MTTETKAKPKAKPKAKEPVKTSSTNGNGNAPDPQRETNRLATIAFGQYLELLATTGKAPAGRLTVEVAQQRRANAEEALRTAKENGLSQLARLKLIQQRREAEERLAVDDTTLFGAAEEAFIAIGAQTATRLGLSYGAMRELGVPAATLNKAGITSNTHP